MFATDPQTLRAELLALARGPETADSIMLYAGKLPTSWSTPPRTACSRARLDRFRGRLPRNPGLFPRWLAADAQNCFNEFHALLVRVARTTAAKRRVRCLPAGRPAARGGPLLVRIRTSGCSMASRPRARLQWEPLAVPAELFSAAKAAIDRELVGERPISRTQMTDPTTDNPYASPRLT